MTADRLPRTETPVRADLPQQHQAGGRLPQRHPASVAFGAIDAAFEPASADPWFDNDIRVVGA
ncbi:hypothetical protein ABZ863_24870 [Saccharomonospora sp. NPDC046836]|uniref:hypothetical protein n=1 Tax=Saccharomonospora sp. NPDC046836 TaxID=3156921 RepID=UPI0034069EA5